MKEQIRIQEMREIAGGFLVRISTLEEPLKIPLELVSRHRLKADTVLTAPQIVQLREEVELLACDREAARLLAVREHSVGEIKVKLKRKRFPSEVVHQTVEKYRNQGLLDDAHYANACGRRILDRNPAGRSYLIAALRRKLIDRSLAETTADMLLADQDETDLAVEVLTRSRSRWSEFDIETARRKAYNYLSRRGIGYRAAREAFDRLYEAPEEE